MKQLIIIFLLLPFWVHSQICTPCCCDSPTVVSISGDVVACGDEILTCTATSSDPNSNFVWSNSQIDNNTNQSVNSFLVTESFTISVTITDSEGCEFVIEKMITHYDLPVPSTISVCENPGDQPNNWQSSSCSENESIVCNLDLMTIFSTPSGGIWTGNAVSTNGIWDMTNFTDGQYIFNYSVDPSCDEDYTIDVLASIPYQTISYCNDDNVSYNGFTEFSISNNYNVTDAACNSNTNPSFNSFVPSSLTPGVYTWLVTNPNADLDDCNFCTSYVEIVINQAPQTLPNTLNLVSCINTDITCTIDLNTYIPNNAPLIVEWTNVNGGPSTTTSGTISDPLTTGTFQYQYEIFSACGNETGLIEIQFIDFGPIADQVFCTTDNSFNIVGNGPDDLISGDINDFIIMGSTNNIDPSTFTQQTVLDISIFQNSLNSVDLICNCYYNFTITIDIEPDAILTTNTLDACEDCDNNAINFDLNILVDNNSTPGQWYEGDESTNCDDSGTLLGSTIVSPPYGKTQFTFVSEGTGGCDDIFSCQLLDVYNSPDVQQHITLELNDTYDYCDCDSNPDIIIDIVDNSIDGDCLQTLIDLSGTDGFFHSITWPTLSLGESTINNGQSLSIPCANLTSGTLNIQMDFESGNTNTTTCVDEPYFIDLVVPSCCEDCLFSLEARNEPDNGHLTYNDCETITLGAGGKRIRYYADVTLIQNCPSSGITETVVDADDSFIFGLYTICTSSSIIANDDGLTFDQGGFFAVPDPNNSASEIADYLNANNPVATFFSSGNTVCFEIDADNTDGFDASSVGLTINSAFSVDNDYDDSAPCGAVDVLYSDNLNNPDVEYLSSSGDIELTYNDIIISTCTDLDVNLISQTNQTCQVCP